MERLPPCCAPTGLPCSVHRYWGCTLYHPDDLPFHLWACGSASSGGRPGAAAVAGPAAEQQQQQRGQCSRVNREQQRFACLPAVMTDFRKAVQAHARVRPPLPAPRLASNSGGGGDGSAPTLPPLPAATAAAAAEAGLLGPLPTDLASVYSAAGGAATAALACWEALGAVRCAALAPACSGRHDARSALPFGMGEEQAVQRLRYYLGLEESDGHSVRSVDQEAPIATYRETRMQVGRQLLLFCAARASWCSHNGKVLVAWTCGWAGVHARTSLAACPALGCLATNQPPTTHPH